MDKLKGSIKPFSVYHTDAYMIAVKHGFEGTEAEWLESLKMSNEEVSEAVADYLAKNPVAIDKTLTVSGQAADAKVTGEAIAELQKKAEESAENTNTHVINKENPHGVTAEQVGARPNDWMPTAAEVKARPDTWMPTAEEVGATPASHATDKNNPHGVTASQVGARPDDWMPSASEVGARPDTWMPSASEVGARPDTWMPTIEDIGAMPFVESDTYSGCFYRTVDGATEWLNPPMVLGTEYRTTERFKNKVVYVKAINGGAIDEKDITVNIAGSNVLYLYGYITNSDGSVEFFPVINTSTGEAAIFMWYEAKKIKIYSADSVSTSTMTFVIKYTK